MSYKETGIVLSDRMIAARICNAGFSVEEVHDSLQEIQARTEDSDPKEQIGKYIGREKTMYEKMKGSVSRDIYKLSVRYEKDDDYYGNGYFSDFDTLRGGRRSIWNLRGYRSLPGSRFIRTMCSFEAINIKTINIKWFKHLKIMDF